MTPMADKQTKKTHIKKGVYDKYRLISAVGTGVHGKVFKVQHREKGTFFSLKQIDKEFTKFHRKELTVLRDLQGCERVLNLVDFYETVKFSMFICQFCGNGDLFDYMTSRTLSVEESVKITQGILESLKELHSKKYVHLDIKPENIGLSDNLTPIIIDLGCAELCKDDDNLNTISRDVGTAAYSAPEVTKYKLYSFKTDVWGVGMCLFTMLNNKLPCSLLGSRNNGIPIYEDIDQSIKDMKGFDKRVCDFLFKSLDIKPARRISIQEFLNDIMLFNK